MSNDLPLEKWDGSDLMAEIERLREEVENVATHGLYWARRAKAADAEIERLREENAKLKTERDAALAQTADAAQARGRALREQALRGKTKQP